MLLFAWNGGQMFEDLKARRSVMIHRVRRHTHFYNNNWGMCFDDRAFRIFLNG